MSLMQLTNTVGRTDSFWNMARAINLEYMIGYDSVMKDNLYRIFRYNLIPFNFCHYHYRLASLFFHRPSLGFDHILPFIHL